MKASRSRWVNRAPDRHDRRLIDYAALTVPQQLFLHDEGQITVWRDGNQLGKAQPTDADVLTPTGWRKLGDIAPGDMIIAGDGSAVRVLSVHPQGRRQVYAMTFDDGATTECCEEHLWTVLDSEARFRKTSRRYGVWRTMNLGEIMGRWGRTPTPKQRIAIPAPGPAQMDAHPVPLDPYLLGVLLGDGCTSQPDQVTFTTADAEIVESVRNALPPGDKMRAHNRLAWGISGTGGVNKTLRALRALGVQGCRSYQKRVPVSYLHNSIEVRLAVLQGLMDTDGYCSKDGAIEFDSTSRQLATDVVFLARSLGAKTQWSSKPAWYVDKHGQRVCSRMSYRVRIRLPVIRIFRLARKLERVRDVESTCSHRVLHRIEPSRITDCVCITVAHPSHTYVTSDFIVTHNSYGLAFDLIQFVRGQHPVQTHRPPVTVPVFGYSIDQMYSLMEKIWLLTPKDEVSEACGFEPGRGITGKPPRLVFTSGPGKGSVIVFATYKQGARRIAGMTVPRIYGDEPMPERVYGELIPRILKQKGRIRLGFTPTPDMPDVTYLKRKVDDGEIGEHNYGLSEANCWPAGYPMPWLPQSEIDTYERLLHSSERDMRMGRSWFPAVSGRMLEHFGDENVIRVSIGELAGAWLVISTDHGAAANKEAAMLIAIQDRLSSRPRVTWLDEYVVEGITTPEADAAGMLAMLRRNGLDYDDVDYWVGDVPTGSKKYDIRKSNADLRRELAAALRRPIQKCARIHGPKKWAGSMSWGANLLDNIMARRTDDGTPHGRVHPRCATFIKACKEFNGHPQHPMKDVFDAGRYGVERSVSKAAGVQLVARY